MTEKSTELKGKKILRILVIGGNGYVGKLLVKRFLERYQNALIRVLDNNFPKNTFSLKNPRVEYICGDLCDFDVINKSCCGIDWVFHLATPSYLVIDEKILKKVNIDGTKSIILASIRQQVKQIIYCSSASVAFGNKEILFGDEKLPYVRQNDTNAYNFTKSIGEKLVLLAHKSSTIEDFKMRMDQFSSEIDNANLFQNGRKDCRSPKIRNTILEKSTETRDKEIDSNRKNNINHEDVEKSSLSAEKKSVHENSIYHLKTVALRPHSIYGFNSFDSFGIVDPMLDAVQKGKNKFIVGNGNNYSDFTDVENVVYSHILAAEVLDQEGDKDIKNYYSKETSHDSEDEDFLFKYHRNINIEEKDKIGGKINNEDNNIKNNKFKSKNIGGNAFNITNDHPIKFWDFFCDLCRESSYKAPQIRLPYTLILIVATILEIIFGVNNSKITFKTQRVHLLGLNHFYSIKKAKKYLGYEPIISQKKSFRRMIKHLKLSGRINK